MFALNLEDRLSTRLCLNTSFSRGVAGAIGFTYGAYRLGNGSAPLVFGADIAAVAADPRAALGFLAWRHPTLFEPASDVSNVSGTGWYSHCGPGVGGCDLMATNHTFAKELAEINFAWVW